MKGLIFENVSLSILQAEKPTQILEDANLILPPKTMALVGESRVEVVAVLDLLCRRLIPQRGKIHFGGAVSWPIGRSGPFFITITGTQAISHFSVVYGFDRAQALAFMRAEFPKRELLTRPISTWPKKLQTQFTMLMALIPEFDIYLVDANIILPDDVVFCQRFLKLFNMRRQGKTTLITARQRKVLHALCDGAIVVANRHIYRQKNLDAALAISNQISYEISSSEDKKDTFDYDMMI